MRASFIRRAAGNPPGNARIARERPSSAHAIRETAMSTAPTAPAALARPAGNSDVVDWRPEDETFWEATGKKIAYRNLALSVPALLCGFAVWGMWGIITVQMLNLGFPFSQAELFTLTAIAGIAGATMRIPASFLIRVAGGRNTIFLTTAMLLAPAIGTGIVLQHKDWPLWAFQLMALWSGVGGGNFASSMSNISTFFPKRLQGTALGINAGIGNFGVTTMQIVIPLVMTMGIFGALGGEPMTLMKDSGWIFGKIAAGTPTWVQNAGFAWVLSLVPLSILCWWGMNNLKTVSPDTGNPIVAFARITWLYTLAFIPSILGLYLYLPKPTGLGLISMWVAIPLDVVAALVVMRLAAFGPMKEAVAKQMAIFRDKHTWSMTLLYIVTFGSFIGFSMALPLAMKVIFGVSHVPDANGVMQHTANNPNAPTVLAYAWIGPFVGAAIRPVGGWISDKVGGSIVTQIISVVMVAASIAVGYVMMLAYRSPTPEEYFFAFLALFIVLFAASGIGNGSTFRTIGVIFDRVQAGPVLGWTSAIAAYGAFVAPIVIGEQIKAGTPQVAMYGFAVFYGLCLVLNWWFYLRRNAYVKNP
jgi:NNP family nitrate/nitrite transporter-like MFS transporter